MMLYHLTEDGLVKDMARMQRETLRDPANGGMRAEAAAQLLQSLLPPLLAFGEERGLAGNLWQYYLAECLVRDKNAYSLACERKRCEDGTVRRAALLDLREIRELYTYEFAPLSQMAGMGELSLLADFVPAFRECRAYEEEARDAVATLAKDLGTCADVERFRDRLEAFYGRYGVGIFAFSKGFEFEEEKERLRPLRRIAPAHLDDLVGYESAKERLLANTNAFLEGRPANNVLLYGEAGTGKSTCIKALCHNNYAAGLRVIQVFRYQYRALPALLRQIRNRNYRFLLFLDDLSFEEFETEYKLLKAVIEGGLEERPDNVLIYATSNRRHLVREQFSDRDGLGIGDKHAGDTVQEKLSLSERFGITIYFPSPAQAEYHNIVRELAARYELAIPEERLLEEATRWELRHGGPSGRAARQFVDDLRSRA